MAEDLAVISRSHTGHQALPEAPAREAWLVVGRRAGKSRIAARGRLAGVLPGFGFSPNPLENLVEELARGQVLGRNPPVALVDGHKGVQG